MSSVTTSPECLPKVLRASALLLAFIGTLVPQAAHCDSKMSEASGSPSQNAKTAATEVATLRENGGVDVMGLDFSADGKFLASNSSWVMSGHAKGLDIHIWDWRGGQITRSLEKEGRIEHFIKEPL